MANIYEQKAEPLYALLERASTAAGATVVIPELQRQYVWTPHQVTLLLDSLIRGWPFGTLLMWKVNHQDIEGIPHRAFWDLIDRTADGEETSVRRMDPPADFHMVLDGQQRLQSLLLALGGDGWGFKLEDRDWAEELQDRRPRGRQPKHRHWAKATLCFDLDAFLSEYVTTQNVPYVDFRNVLRWAITDTTEGQSTWPKQKGYVEPLPRAAADAHSLIRLSRLWEAIPPNTNLKEKEFQKIALTFLEKQAVPDGKIAGALAPLGELMTTLRDLKLSKVTFLELVPFDAALWSREEYNDAVVNIFTRLNTAGRTLTKEEITFAWLKSHWTPAATGNKSAAECFTELREELKKRGLDIDMDDVVNAVSFMWSVRFNEGKLLTNNDLLKGSVIGEMAQDLCGWWQILCNSMLDVMSVVEDHGFVFGSAGQYASVTALAVLWGWHSLGPSWQATHGLKATEKDSFEHKCSEALNKLVDRWLLCSTWAGRWSAASSSPAQPYAKELADGWKVLQTVAKADSAADQIRSCLEGFVKALESDAVAGVDGLSASRERVSAYRGVLWIWHRLDAERWKMSSIPLRIGKKVKTNLEVDHIVSFARWTRLVTKQLPVDHDDIAEASAEANLLGNCSLLEKTFNIEKTDGTLMTFMNEVHQIKTGTIALPDWTKALSIPDELLDPDSANPDTILVAMRARDVAVRNDVKDFVVGCKSRCDLS